MGDFDPGVGGLPRGVVVVKALDVLRGDMGPFGDVSAGFVADVLDKVCEKDVKIGVIFRNVIMAHILLLLD
jgi:hypothetical protein